MLNELSVNTIYQGDCIQVLKKIPDNSIDCCVTSPPYFGLRDYGQAHQIGLENTPELYVSKMVELFEEVRRVLKPTGTLWLNLGDSYAAYWGQKYGQGQSLSGTRENKGSSPPSKKSPVFENGGIKPKDLFGIPWTVAFAMRSAGWYLRQDIIWSKPNPMPESVTDRCTKSHEYIFLLSKSQKYYWDQDSIKVRCITNENRPSGVERNRTYGYNSKENNNPSAYLKNASWKGSSFDKGKTREMQMTRGHTRKSGNKERKPRPGPINNTSNQCGSVPWEGSLANKRSVWNVATTPFKGAHFATFPEKLIIDCIKAGCPENGIVLDPFMGSGTTALVAAKTNRNYIGIELNPDYIELANSRLQNTLGLFNPQPYNIEL